MRRESLYGPTEHRRRCDSGTGEEEEDSEALVLDVNSTNERWRKFVEDQRRQFLQSKKLPEQQTPSPIPNSVTNLLRMDNEDTLLVESEDQSTTERDTYRILSTLSPQENLIMDNLANLLMNEQPELLNIEQIF